MNVSVTTFGKRCNVPLVCIKYKLLVKACGNSLCGTVLTSGVDAVLSPVHPHVSPRPLSLSLLVGGWEGGVRRGASPPAHWKHCGLLGRDWLETSISVTQCLVDSELRRRLSAMPNGRTEENRQGGRAEEHEVTTGHVQAVFHSKHLRIIPSFSCYTEFFSLSHNFTASLKRKSIYHSVQICESLNRWKTSTDKQRFPTGPPAACKMVWISVATNWQTFSTPIVCVYWKDSHALVVKPSYSPCELMSSPTDLYSQVQRPLCLISQAPLSMRVFTDSWILNKSKIQ